MKKIILLLFVFCFSFSGIAVAALYEGSWNTNQPGAMPGGDTLRNGEYHQDWHGSWPIGIGTEVEWTSIGDSGTQWTVQGTRTSAIVGSGWSGWEGGFFYGYEPIAATYVGDGQLLFDGDLYTGSGWTQNFTYTNRYRRDFVNSEWDYIGTLNMTAVGYGGFDGQPFDINFSLTFQQDSYNLTELWDEGHSSYMEIEISQVPVPAAFWLLSSGIIGFLVIRRKTVE